jgi:hypothetical protein
MFCVARFNAVSAQFGRFRDDGVSGSASHDRTFRAATGCPVSLAINSAAWACVIPYWSKTARNSLFFSRSSSCSSVLIRALISGRCRRYHRFGFALLYCGPVVV